MIFPFIEFLGLAEERIYRPIIPINFSAKNHLYNTYALIDSGADYSILPIEVAGRFKFSLSDQLQYLIQGAGGNIFTLYRSTVEVDHTIKKKGFRDFKWKSHVFFAESATTTLLGFKGFLENFSVKLDGKKRDIKITH